MTDLLELGASVEWTDTGSAAAARSGGDDGLGRLAEIVEWLAAAQGRFPPAVPTRVRCLRFGTDAARPGDGGHTLADEFDVGIVDADPATGPAEAFGHGRELADAEIEAGADLVIVTGHDGGSAAAAVVSLLAGTEPVALLPRGGAAVDTRAWIERAERLRDARRRIASLRDDPDAVLATLAAPMLAAACGAVLRTVARRTPLLLDGTLAVAAALLCHAAQARAGRWWRVADTSADPAHDRAVDELGQRPLLALGSSADDGTAGVLAAVLVRAAAGTP